MSTTLLGGAAFSLTLCASPAADFTPAAQQFRQEVAQHFTERDGAPTGRVQLVECTPSGTNRVVAAGQWYEFQDGRWQVNPVLKPESGAQFIFAESKGRPAGAPVPWREVRQLLRAGATNFV